MAWLEEETAFHSDVGAISRWFRGLHGAGGD